MKLQLNETAAPLPQTQDKEIFLDIPRKSCCFLSGIDDVEDKVEILS